MPSEAGAACRTIQANVILLALPAANSRTYFNIGINYNLAQLVGWPASVMSTPLLAHGE